MRVRTVPSTFALAILGSVYFASGATAETLTFDCKASDSSQSQHLTIDLERGLVSNEAGGSGRPWAARTTGNDISWDEVFDSRIGRIANHYVLDRGTGTLHRTDMTRSEDRREAASSVCQKSS